MPYNPLLWIPLALAVGGGVHNVPGDYPTIQEAITVAAAGDVVEVAPGTYSETIDFLGRSIIVRSLGGPLVTTIDGGAAASVVTFSTGEGPGSVLDGFTIQGGTGTDCFGSLCGGGVICDGASPTIRNNRIRENLADFGGGVACIGGSEAILSGNEIGPHGLLGGLGAGVAVRDSFPIVTNNLICLNSGATLGGGVYSENSLATLQGNQIHENSAGDGGGLALIGGDDLVRGNQFLDNGAAGGAGIFAQNSAASIRDNTFEGGFAQIGGVFLVLDSSFVPTIVNNLFCGNTATAGAVLRSANCSGVLALINCTAVANGGGFGLAVADDAPFRFESSILEDAFLVSTTGFEVEYCNTPETPTPGVGNISADPIFVAGPQGDFYLSQIAAGDGADSPSVDTGNPTGSVLDGTTRSDEIVDVGTVDMGFHYPIPEHVFLRGDCNGDAESLNLSDGVSGLQFLFSGFRPPCESACDANGDGALNLEDPLFVLSFLFVIGSPAPSAPYPDCGLDPMPAAISCGLPSRCP